MPLPKYDPEMAGNRFAWIIEQARQIRDQRQEAERHRFTQADRAMMRQHDELVDMADKDRIRRLREKCDPQRGRATDKVACTLPPTNRATT